MAKFYKGAKEIAQKIATILWCFYLYLFHWWIFGIFALILSGFTKRDYFQWYDKIVTDFIRWSEDTMEEWRENYEDEWL